MSVFGNRLTGAFGNNLIEQFLVGDFGRKAAFGEQFQKILSLLASGFPVSDLQTKEACPKAERSAIRCRAMIPNPSPLPKTKQTSYR